MILAAKRIAAGLALPLVLCSCASDHAALTLNPDAVPPSELVGRVNARAFGVRSMTGRGSLWFESAGGAGSAFFTMSLRKPDSLLVRLKGPFGVEVGLFFLSRDRFVIYNGMENLVITGVPSGGTLRSIIPVALTYDQILDAFSGTLAVDSTRGRLIRYAIEDGQYLLSYSRSGDTCTYWVDPETYLVRRFIETGDGGRLRLEANTGSILEQEGVFAPRTVQVRLDHQQLSIKYTSLDLNAADPSFDFSIPQGVRTTVR